MKPIRKSLFLLLALFLTLALPLMAQATMAYDDSPCSQSATGTHDFYFVSSQEATCQHGIIETYRCSSCGKTITTEYGAYGSHDWREEGRAPTCTQNGYQCLRCSVCKETARYMEIPATGHTPVDAAGREPTCTEPGLSAGVKCSVCGETLQGQTTIPALGHDWGDWEKESDGNCTEPGLKKHRCNRCRIEEYNYSGFGDHDWGDWEVEIPATPDSAGVEKRVCKINPEHVERRDLLYTGMNETDEPKLTISKIWDDEDDAAGARPDSITVTLLLNNDPVDSVELYPGNGWSDTIYKPYQPATVGTVYDYTWVESPVPGYTLTAVDTVGDEVILTNTYVGNAAPADLFAGLRMTVSQPKPDKAVYTVGEQVSFDITLHNVGNVALTNCQAKIIDGDGTEYALDYGDLAAEEAKTLTWTVTINENHLANGRDLINFEGSGWVPQEILDSGAAVFGHENGLVLAEPDERDLTVQGGIDDQFALHLDVEVTPVQSVYDVDEILFFKETVTNTSSDTLYDVYIEISYDSTGVDSSGCQYIGTLAPHESKDTYDHSTIATMDKDYAKAHDGKHSIHWIAYGYTVSGESVDPNAKVSSNDCVFTETFGEEPVPPVTAAPKIEITGIANGSGAGKQVGDYVDAVITVKNTGNVPWFASEMCVYTFEDASYNWDDFNGNYYNKEYAPGEGFTTTVGIKVTQADAENGYVERTFFSTCLYNGESYSSNDAAAHIPLDGITPPVSKTPEAGLQLSVVCLDSEPFAFGEENKTGDIHYQAVVKYIWTGDPNSADSYPHKTATVDKIEITTKSGTFTQSVGPYTLYLNDSTPNIPLSYNFHTDELGGDGLLHISFVATGADDAKALVSNIVDLSHEVLDMPPWNPDPETKTIVEKYVVSTPADPNGYQLNETVDYEIWVYNDSEITIPSVEVEDPLFGGVVGTITDLLPATWGYVSASYTVTQQDVDNTQIVNTAIAKWTDPETELNLEKKSNTVTVNTIGPDNGEGGVWIDITFEKEPANGSFYVLGETFPIRVDWKNNTNKTLYHANMFDALANIMGHSSELFNDRTLAPGESGSFTYNYVVDESNVNYSGDVYDYAFIDGYDQDGKYYYAEDVETRPAGGSTDPEIKNPGLKVEKKETSIPADGRAYYIEGETITYDIILTNTGNVDLVNLLVGDSLCDSIDGVFAALPVLPVNSSVSYSFAYKVTAQDVKNTKVINYGIGYYCYDKLIDVPVFSEPVESPTGPQPGPTPPHDPDGHIDTPIVKDGKDDCCVLTLTGRGAGASEYEQHLCTKHLAVCEKVQRQAEAMGADLNAKAEVWKQAANEWKMALDEMYQAILDASDGPARAKVMAERGIFFAYVDSLRALMLSQNSRDPAAAEQGAAEMMMRQCAELCYVIHCAPEDRPDSIVFSNCSFLAVSSASNQCLVSQQPAENGDIHILELLCEDHARIDAGALALVRQAKSRAALSEAFVTARRSWTIELNNMVTAQFKAAEKADRQQISACRKLFDSLVENREALYSLIYAGHPEIVNEVLMRNTMQDVLMRCK